MPHDDAKDEIEALNFGVEKSMRYHQRRRGHYEWIHRSIMFLTVLSGSAAFAGVFEWPQYFGAAAALLAAIDLVWSPSHRARDHEMLFRRFSDLVIEIRTNRSRNDEDLAKLTERRLLIEKDELPVYWALEADCDNEVRRAWGKNDKLVFFDWWSRLTMYWHRHSQAVYEPKPASG